MPLKKETIVNLQVDGKKSSQRDDENDKYEWHSAQEIQPPNGQNEQNKCIKSSGHVSNVSMFDKALYE